MVQLDGIEATIFSTFTDYEQNEQNPQADAVLGQIDGEAINFTVESDYDTMYFSVGIPHDSFDEPLPQALAAVRGFESFNTDLQRAVLKKFLRKTNLTLTKTKENSTYAIYRAQMPLVIDDTEEDDE